MTKLTPKKRAVFLQKLAEYASVTKAAGAIKVSRNALYEKKKSDKKFSKAWDDALEIAVGALEDEAVRRGKDGVLKPVFYKGKKVGTIREYSDTLLICLLNAHRPEKYRANHKVEHVGKDGEKLSFTLKIGEKGEG